MQFNICFPLCWKWIEAGRRNTSRGIYLFCKQYISGLDSYLTFMVALACPDARYKYLANLVILCSFTKISFLFHKNIFFSFTQITFLFNTNTLFSFIQISCQRCHPFLFHTKPFQILNLICWKHKQSFSFYSVWQKRIHQTMKWHNMNFGGQFINIISCLYFITSKVS